jgi:YidC/Oxa1 family membrane protein insertase
MYEFIDSVLSPIIFVITWLLFYFHEGLSLVLPPAAGITWALAIVFLVILIRILLIPLFVRQVRSMRGMQLLQPKMKEIQTKFGHDRERMGQEMMKLYRETGTNPFASCLPILLQAPIFFALFRVLQAGVAQKVPLGYFENHVEALLQANAATLFGVPLWGFFSGADETPNPTATRILTMVLVVLMSITTFITQRQLIVKNTAADNPVVRQQKIMLYLFPIMFAVGGVFFPLGVLIYWLTTNIWSMGQQFWIIRNNPSPGTPAYAAWEARKKQKAKEKAIKRGEVPEEEPEPQPVVRQQPKRKSRKRRKGN